MLTKVEMKPPVGNSIPFNAGSRTVIKDESLGLQNSDEAYTKISGNWAFTFHGSMASGARSSFVVSRTVSVSASAQQ